MFLRRNSNNIHNILMLFPSGTSPVVGSELSKSPRRQLYARGKALRSSFRRSKLSVLQTQSHIPPTRTFCDTPLSKMGSITTPSYALSKSHQDVSSYPTDVVEIAVTLTILQLLEKSLVEIDPEVAAIMVPHFRSLYHGYDTNQNTNRKKKSEDSANQLSSLPQKTSPPVQSSMPLARPCQISIRRAIQAQDTMVVINTSIPLRSCVRTERLRPSTSIRRNGALMFNA
jgi:hypothetical protein